MPDLIAVADGLSLFSTDALVALLTLTAMEIVLGIDNIIFIAILVGKLPQQEQAKARRMGLILAMGIRILLLLSISWVMSLKATIFSLPKFWTAVAGDLHEVSGKDLILLVGGLFLVAKATWEIHDKLEGHETPGGASGTLASFGKTIVQILLLDIVFSLDSVITAVGMTSRIPVMITAVVIAVGVMLVFAGSVASFVHRHPTVKMLALSFLILIGVMLVVEGGHGHVNKGYIYFAMAFSLGVELLNMRLRKKAPPVELRHTTAQEV